MTINRDDIRRIVQEVLAELYKQEKAPAIKTERPADGPRAFFVFHPGTRLVEEAVRQVGLMEAMCAKTSVYTSDAVRGRICGGDVKREAGTRCILDTVGADGLESVLDRADILVLPTMCFAIASKVSSLIMDDPDVRLLLRALMRGKKVLAANDGFMLLNDLNNDGIRREIGLVLDKLAGYGLKLCPTEQLAETFKSMATAADDAAPIKTPAKVESPSGVSDLALITANDIRAAVNEGRSRLVLAPRGKITPLARDLAKEYSIEIVVSGD